MASRVFPSVPEPYKDFLEDENLSASSLLQEAIEEEAEKRGVDLESYSG